MRSKFKTVKDLLIGNMVIESRQLVNYGTLMGGRGELNPQPAAPQAAALPLSYDLHAPSPTWQPSLTRRAWRDSLRHFVPQCKLLTPHRHFVNLRRSAELAEVRAWRDSNPQPIA